MPAVSSNKNDVVTRGKAQGVDAEFRVAGI